MRETAAPGADTAMEGRLEAPQAHSWAVQGLAALHPQADFLLRACLRPLCRLLLLHLRRLLAVALPGKMRPCLLQRPAAPHQR